MTAHCSLEDLIRFVENKSNKLLSEHLASCEQCRNAAVLVASDSGRMKTKAASTLFHTHHDEQLSIVCRNGRFQSEQNSGFSILNPIAARGKKASPCFVSSFLSVMPHGNTITIIIPSVKKECVLLRDNTVLEHLSGKKNDIIFSKLTAGSYTVTVDGKKTFIVFTSAKPNARIKAKRTRP
ncbi:MAG: hypothetical protein HZC28_19810 [Spirochaetes bacterium]|nr:hypothetical protein [Spirochaetota bacterium]